MARIERWPYEKKVNRKERIGDHVPCPICFKTSLSVWEGERYLVCIRCGAKYQKKQKYRKKK